MTNDQICSYNMEDRMLGVWMGEQAKSPRNANHMHVITMPLP